MAAQKEKGIVKAEFSDQVAQGYYDYAMEVITARALPDVFTGLKPVQQRILQTMTDLGLKHNVPYKKSARTVGQCLGIYHPHGIESYHYSYVIC